MYSTSMTVQTVCSIFLRHHFACIALTGNNHLISLIALTESNPLQSTTQITSGQAN